MIDTSVAQVLTIPDVIGFHLNVVASAITPEMEEARVHPSSPAVVFMGDPGVPRTLHLIGEDGTETSVPNPDWHEDAAPYATGFFLFTDEAEARELAPHLFVEDPSV